MAGALTVLDNGFLAADDFNRPALGANWTVAGGTWAISANTEARETGTGGYLIRNDIAARQNVYLQATMQDGGTATQTALFARYVAGPLAYMGECGGTPDAGAHWYTAITDQTHTDLAHGSDTDSHLANQRRFNFSIRDAGARVWKAGTLMATAAGLTVRSGLVGLHSFNAGSSADFDDFIAAKGDSIALSTAVPAGFFLRYPGVPDGDPSDGTTPIEIDIGGPAMPLTGDVELLDGSEVVRATLSGATLYGGAVLSFADTPRYDVTLFEADGETPVMGSVDLDGNVTESSFSTDPEHPRPWLAWPKEGSGSEVDFLAGKAKIGQYNVEVGDFWSDPADQTTGQITALLGPYNGLNGLRCRLTYTDASGATTCIIDGPVSTPRLHESFAGYSWGIRDENWRTRKMKAFYRTGTTCVFPRGPLSPYGLLPSGEYAIPAAGVARGTYVNDAATQGHVSIDSVQLVVGPYVHSESNKPHFVLTQAMAQASEFIWDEPAGDYILKNCTVRWRLAAGPGAWNDLVDMPGYKAGSTAAALVRVRPLFKTARTTLRYHDTLGEEREYKDTEIITQLRLVSVVGDGTDLPGPGDAVEVQVIYTGPASEAYPLTGDGTAGDFLAAFYDGDFSSDTPPVRYDAAAVAAFTQPCSWRITKPTDDGLGWLEKNWYQPLAAAPTLDADGRIAPTLYLLPDETVDLLTLDDATMEASPDFEHGDDGVINEPKFTYYRDVLVDVRDDPLGERSGGDLVYSREITIEGWESEDGTGPSHDRFGPKPHEIKTELFRALGRNDGTPAAGEATSEVGHVLGRERCKQALDRFLYGAASWSIHTDRVTAAGVNLGDWIECGASWLPDYISELRGMNRVAQVVGIHDDPLSPRRTLMVEDGGDALAPLAQPTVGVAAENVEGGITLPVTTVVAGTEALGEYALSGALPAADSKLWTPFGRTAAAADLDTPQMPAGASVWIRARSVAANRRPSLGTTPQQVILSETPRLTHVRVYVDPATNAVTVSWLPNAFALGVRVYYVVVATEDLESASPTAYLDVDASDGEVVLPDAALIGQVAVVDAEPYEGWTGAAVSGAAGPSVRAYGGIGYGPVINDLDTTDLADGRVELDASFNAAVVRAEVWNRTDASPLSGGEPLAEYTVGRYKPQDFPINWSVANGTQNVFVRAFDELGQVAEASATQATTGGTGGSSGGTTAPTDRPGTPRLELGAVVGGDQEAEANWYNTNAALPIETDWYINGISVGDVNGPLAAGTTLDSITTSIGDLVRVRLRYLDGVLPGPWSNPSNELELTG